MAACSLAGAFRIRVDFCIEENVFVVQICSVLSKDNFVHRENQNFDEISDWVAKHARLEALPEHVHVERWMDCYHDAWPHLCP